MNDVERIKLYRRSPLAWVRDIFKLVPQPLIAGIPDDKPAEFYSPEHFHPFIKGEHLTWQQWLIFRAVEWALAGKAPRWISVASGHGIGKSATESLLILWFLFCWKSKIGCTAPTADQLFDILWSEISIWRNRMPEAIKNIYIWQSDYLRIAESPETWFARARTARVDKPEALAGLHADHVGIFVDEASGVEDVIFKTAHGALTNSNTLVVMISNPTRSVGYFYDSHHRDKGSWQCLSFSSLESPIVDNQFVDLIRRKYGEGSAEWLIRVEGKFPPEDAIDDKGYVQLIPENDMRLTLDTAMPGSKRLGIDPSGLGNNKTVFVIRTSLKGGVAGSFPKSTPAEIAMQTATLMEEHGIPDSDVFLDIFGVGAETFQKLALMGYNVNGVNVDREASEPDQFINLRAEAFWNMKKWLRSGGELVEHEGWEDLKTLRYRRNLHGKIQIMPKTDMQKLGLSSPDYSDALMLTFTQPDTYPVTDDDTSPYPYASAGRLG